MALTSRGTLWTTGSGQATPGTAVIQQAGITAFSDTGPLFVMKNNGATGTASIWPVYLRLINATGTPATGTISLELAVKVDSTSKLPTAANQYTNPLNVNCDTRDTTSASNAIVYHYLAAQAMVTPASSASVRVVHRSRIPTGVNVLGDEYVFQFNQQDQPFVQKPGLTAARATDTATIIGQGAGFNIAPGLWATFHLWWLTAAANIPSWETELVWYEL